MTTRRCTRSIASRRFYPRVRDSRRVVASDLQQASGKVQREVARGPGPQTVQHDALEGSEVLYIYDNDSLTVTTGLTSLESAGGVSINHNDALTDITGLTSLTEVDEDLLIYGHDALTDISGLSSLAAVGGNLSIYDNEYLCLSLVESLIAGLSGGLGGTILDITGNDDDC